MEKRWTVFCAIVVFALATAAFALPPAYELHPGLALGTPFWDGDQLVPTGDGHVQWYRGGQLLATLADPGGVVNDRLDPSRPLYVTDAEGNRVLEVKPGMALFISTEAPEIIFYKQGEPTPFRAAAGSNLNYNGGRVFTPASNTVAIYWGSWSGSAIPNGLASFFTGFDASNYAGIADQYYEIVGGTTNYVTSASNYLGAVFDASNPPKRALSTSQAVAEACKFLGDTADPANTLFLIYTSTGAGHVNYCAWHSWGSCSNGTQVQVAYMPNISNVAGCQNPNASGEVAALANVTAHELMETITDPRGASWYDSSGAEIGDKCAWQFTGPVTLSNGTSWWLQEEWSNAVSGCVQGQ